jgi:hypothetical protein
MPKQELDLLQIAAILAAELGTGPAEVVRTKSLDAYFLGGLLDHGPVGKCRAALESRICASLFSTIFRELTTSLLHLNPGLLYLNPGQSLC